jgi:hypothetical protein
MLGRFMRVLLVTSPMVQFNTVYPAAPMLAAFLRQHGHQVAHEDLSLALALRLFSPTGVRAVARVLRRRFAERRRPASVRHFLRHASQIEARVADVVLLLQGRAPELVDALAPAGSLPEGPRFAAMGDLDDDDVETVARQRASLFLDEIADAVREGVDPRFELARYAEALTADARSFDGLAGALDGRRTLIDRWIDELAQAAWQQHRPQVLGCTVPFPGALYGALRIARAFKRLSPRITTVLGGGYVNTELRELTEPRLFEHFDFVTYDDGEIPLARIVEFRAKQRSVQELVRTRRRERGRVVFCDSAAPPLHHRDRPAPDFSTLPSAGYLGMAESTNPMHRLWSDRPWLKLTLAHGCYWHRCAFCDTSLDYIRRFEPANADVVLGWMEQAMNDTGLDGFHFVDEAAPPALLASVARKIIDRGLQVEWWTNIRWERAFTPELTTLLARSGCIAVTGGLECAHDRLLALMNKGFVLEQARAVMRAFAEAGVLVHAYLMYGYPTQTAQEMVDALDEVRHLFAEDSLHSAYWHRFALTVHSGAFRDERLRLDIVDHRAQAFARNEIPFENPATGALDLSAFGVGLHRAVYNFMHGLGLLADIRSWFDFPVPRPSRRQR